MLETSFGEMQRQINGDVFLELGNYLAYLLKIDPTTWNYLRRFQETLFENGLQNMEDNINN